MTYITLSLLCVAALNVACIHAGIKLIKRISIKPDEMAWELID